MEMDAQPYLVGYLCSDAGFSKRAKAFGMAKRLRAHDAGSSFSLSIASEYGRLGLWMVDAAVMALCVAKAKHQARVFAVSVVEFIRTHSPIISHPPAMTKNLRYFLIALLEPLERNIPHWINWLSVKPSPAEQSNQELDAVTTCGSATTNAVKYTVR